MRFDLAGAARGEEVWRCMAFLDGRGHATSRSAQPSFATALKMAYFQRP